MIKKFLLILVLILNTLLKTYSQTFITKEFLPDTCDKDLFFRFESSMFFKNNEYFTPYTASYTWPGYYLKPMLEYYITPGTRIRLGYFFEKFFGWQYLWRTIPIFSIQQKINNNINLIFGNIYGTTNHEMEEALLRFDRYMLNPVEYGIQLIYQYPKFQGDTWLNWERFIYFNSTFQEEIQFSHNNKILALNYPDVKVFIPIQLIIYHRGGHILVPTNILTTMDMDFGFSINKPLKDKSILTIEPKMFIYQGLYVADTGKNTLPYKHGSAFYFKFKYHKKQFNSFIGMWMPIQFIAPEGEFLINNISEIYTTYYQETRFIFIGKIAKQFNIDKNIYSEINAGFYYDPWLNNFAYYYGLYFNFNQPFYLGKINPQKIKISDLNLPKKL